MLTTRRSAEWTTAAAAAQRELRVIQQALAGDGSAEALQAALQNHGAWLHRLLGCSAEAVRPYLAYRAEMVLRFGLLRDPWQLQEMESCVMSLIRKGATSDAT